MKDSQPAPHAPHSAHKADTRAAWRDLPLRLLIAGAALIAAFGWALYHWGRFALESELYSYTLLVPLVSAYLIGQDLKSPDSAKGSKSFRGLGAGLVALGLLASGAALYLKVTGATLVPQDLVAVGTLPFVLLIAGLCAWELDGPRFRQVAFALAFLIFMVPFPLALEHAIESFLQHGSAPPAYWLFNLVGTPVFRENLVFHLPGITLQIAPECSGIRSTLVLFMTSLLAGHLFLRSTWKQGVLAVAVIPLALARNGFRVFTIGQLCVSVGPHMIDSPIHHRGGPLFFALSLIPFFFLVYLLVRSDRRKAITPTTTS